MESKKTFGKSRDSLDIILLLVSLVLIFFSCWYAKERVIFTDTSVYFFVVSDAGQFYNSSRFVGVLSQILPILGVVSGVSLKGLLYLYSLNFILIPIVSILICRLVFKSKETALAIALFYTIMSSMVFYYPVTEFQMGLCLLLVYHAFLLWYFRQEKTRVILFLSVTLVLLVTVLFAHPLTPIVFYAYLVWILISNPQMRKKLILIPASFPIIIYLLKKLFKEALSVQTSYDNQRMEGIANFNTSFINYFSFNLAKESLGRFSSDYFIAIIIAISVIIYFMIKRRWLLALLFTGLLFSFWLLVSVSFKDSRYDHYAEHLFQPLPFFLALVLATYLNDMTKGKKWIQFTVLSAIFLISFGKINSNHGMFTQRLQWYSNYIDLMHRKGIINGVLQPSYRAFGDEYYYWASSCEAYILSSLPGPDSTVNFKVDWNAHNYNANLQNEDNRRTKYYEFRRLPFVMLDSVASKAELKRLQQVYK